MSWSRHMTLCFAALLGCCALFAVAQQPGPADPKTPETKKPKDEKKAEPKTKEPAKDKLTFDKLSQLPGSIFVLIDEMSQAAGIRPKWMMLPPEEYQALLNELAALKQKLKVERRLAHSSKLSGKLEGDFLALRAEFTFSTDQPRTEISLGMLGAHLVDEGELDKQIPFLDVTDEGYVVRVEKEGSHQLTLNLRLRVVSRKSTTGGLERGVDLGLPGTAVTTMLMELPDSIKEIRWNGELEKSRVNNRWQLSLGSVKSLNVSWKEPVSSPGSGPLQVVDGQLQVRFEESQVTLEANLTLEDLRGQTKEWLLVLPPNTTANNVKIKVPSGITAEHLPPNERTPHHVIRLNEPTQDRVQVNVLTNQSRPAPGQRLLVGPYFVQGAFRQQGTVQVFLPAGSLRGQRPIYHRAAETFQRDLPKNAPGDLETVFQYGNLPSPTKSGKGPRGALELELKSERSQVETRVEHSFRIKPAGEGWEIDWSARVVGKSLDAGGEFLDFSWPRPHWNGPDWLMSGHEGWTALPWGALSLVSSRPLPAGWLSEFQATEEGGAVLDHELIEGRSKMRVAWPRASGKSFVVVLKGKTWLPHVSQRVPLDLPRPLGTLDRGAKVVVQAEESLELLLGPPGSEEPVPDKRRYQLPYEASPASISLAWRQAKREFPVESLVDVVLHERTAQVRQVLTFKALPAAENPGAASRGQVKLHVPSAIRQLKAGAGEKLVEHQSERESAWVVPSDAGDRKQIVLDYDLPLETVQDGVGKVKLRLSLAWPLGCTHQEAKVRCWSGSGVQVTTEGGAADRLWSERGVEVVPGKDRLPSLVLQGAGAELPLTLLCQGMPVSAQAAFVADRALMQFTVDDEGVQRCRARLLVRRINAHMLEVEFPTSIAECQPTVTLDKHKMAWQESPGNARAIRVPVQGELYPQPVVLDVEYQLPASFTGGRPTLQGVLIPPRFEQGVVLGRTRWQVAAPSGALAIPLGSGVALDYHWRLLGWLPTPESSVTAADLEAWLTGREGGDAGFVGQTAFSSPGTGPQRLLFVPRTAWLLACSGALLLAALLLLLVDLPRWSLWLAPAVLAALVLVVGAQWPALLPLLLFGGVPGLLVLVVLLGAHWLMQERYRRRMVMLPGFSRTQPASSVTSANSSPREAPATDKPALAGSKSSRSANPA